ncbi:MAG: cell envelope integrity protein CreD [Gammaproteobacteria bacterium]|nr:cell envelope integrity protein CreD [Gammaproteobacteria bacterium]
MTRLFTSKFAVIGMLTLLFMIALAMLSNLVRERQQYNDNVMSDIGQDYVHPQLILTPFIVIPTSTSQPCSNDQNKTCLYTKDVIINPSHSSWTNQLTVSNDNFKRGIYKAITYTDAVAIKGNFAIPAQLSDASFFQGYSPNATHVVHWDKATIRLSISDLRGLTNQPVMTLNQQKVVFNFPRADRPNRLAMTYTEAPIVINPQAQNLDFALDFELNGMSSLAVIPVGNDMSMSVDANWAHPSFYGASLPQKNIQANRFHATWQNTYIANQNAERLNACMSNGNQPSCDMLKVPENSVFAVKLINAVDTYTMSDRTIKYALLFLMITFGTFFLFEVLKKLRIHPMQYTLVAAALGVFYLLLLSFSEHVGFAVAYLGSSAACVLLISFYVYHVLKGLGRTLLLTTILSAMYASMYVILQSEDLTLILGSILVFVLIAVMMFLTRKVDWYELSTSSKNP